MALSKHERAAYERTIALLRDEILWLRAYVRPEAAVSYAAPPAPLDESGDPWAEYYARQQADVPDLSPQRTPTDDEEAIQEMLENDEIDTTEAEALLRAVGAQNTEIEFAS